MNISKKIKESIIYILQIITLTIIIINFIGRVSIIKGSSMEPEFHSGERVIINLFKYYFSDPKKFEVIVFKCPYDPDKIYIKRVIAQGGEKLEIKNGDVYINDQLSIEPFKIKKYIENYGPIQIPKNHLFVMGDNRQNSEDSRIFGAIPLKLVKGKAALIFWPLGSLEFVK
ncbi:MAG: signal peptidase I [Armatimonadetes bacterium]|nr:signal peptidase I [Armatimonadota bacterium]